MIECALTELKVNYSCRLTDGSILLKGRVVLAGSLVNDYTKLYSNQGDYLGSIRGYYFDFLDRKAFTVL